MPGLVGGEKEPGGATTAEKGTPEIFAGFSPVLKHDVLQVRFVKSIPYVTVPVVVLISDPVVVIGNVDPPRMSPKAIPCFQPIPPPLTISIAASTPVPATVLFMSAMRMPSRPAVGDLLKTSTSIAFTVSGVIPVGIVTTAFMPKKLPWLLFVAAVGADRPYMPTK
jgi:hypothetical protein